MNDPHGQQINFGVTCLNTPDSEVPLAFQPFLNHFFCQ
jgi:hypothetical protein